jgi:hypothetical protein
METAALSVRSIGIRGMYSCGHMRGPIGSEVLQCLILEQPIQCQCRLEWLRGVGTLDVHIHTFANFLSAP